MSGEASIEEMIFGAYWNQAASGDRASAVELASMIRDGRGCTRDPAVAVEILRELALGGEARAMTLLGECYMEGDGVPLDLDAARAWFSKAAGSGDVDAMGALVALLAFNFHDDESQAEAVDWTLHLMEVGGPEWRQVARERLPRALADTPDEVLRKAGRYAIRSLH